jgi:hypothetical protein
MNYPRIASYAGLRSSGAPLVKPDGTLDLELCKKQARFPLMTLDINTIMLHPEIVLKIREFNPTVEILGYHLMTHWWLPPTFVPQPTDKSFNADWHKALQATNGFLTGVPDGYIVDWNNMPTAEALIQLLEKAARTQLFDGFFLDYCSPTVSWVPIGNKFTDETRLRHFRELVERMDDIDAGGPMFIMYGNGVGANQCNMQGTMKEGFPGSLTSFSQALQQTNGDWLKTEIGTPSNTQLARYCLGTACLTGAYGAPAANRNNTPELFDANFWFPEYSVMPDGTPDPTGSHLGWLGEPLGPKVIIDKGIHFRMFEYGVVMVNPTPSSVVIDSLTNRWKKVGDTAIVRQFIIPAQDAVFLIEPR